MMMSFYTIIEMGISGIKNILNIIFRDSETEIEGMIEML